MNITFVAALVGDGDPHKILVCVIMCNDSLKERGLLCCPSIGSDIS